MDVSKRKRHVCDERHRQMQAAVESTENPRPLSEIARDFGVTRERVRQLTVRHRWRRSWRRPRSQPVCSRCGATYSNKGYSDRNAGLKAHVRSAVHREAVARRKAERIDPRWKIERDALTVALYLADYRIRDIAELTGQTGEHVYVVLHRAGLKPNRGLRWERVGIGGHRIARVQDVQVESSSHSAIEGQ